MATEYTEEQHKAVIRILKLKHDAYYEILSVSKTSTGSEIKRAYKKQALIMHPDKNKAPQSDEAFKRISKAFQVLSDETKRKIFDQTGLDPDSRASAAGANPGAGFGGSPFSPFRQPGFGGGNPMAAQADFNDIFQTFFGGPSAFSSGPQMHFQFGGGGPDDIFSALFGNNTRRRRQQREQEKEENGRSVWFSLLVLVVLLILPSILDFITGPSSTKLPRFTFSPVPGYTESRHTPKYHVPFYVKPKDIKSLSKSKLRTLDRAAENHFVSTTRQACSSEYMEQQRLIRNAMGFFSTDYDKLEEARNMKLEHCDILNELGIVPN